MKRITTLLLTSCLIFTTPSFASADLAPSTPDPDKPLSADKITGDVLKRFDKVYQEKKLEQDQLQLDLNAAQNQLERCSKLDGVEVDKCVAEARQHLESLSQRATAIAHDLTTIQKETNDIKQSQ